MKRYVELVTTSSTNRESLLNRLEGLSSSATTWRVWSGVGRHDVARPDLSLIDMSELSWPKVVRAANCCLGKVIVVWGADKSVCGLPLLPTAFQSDDLYQLLVAVSNDRRPSLGARSAANGSWNFPVTVPVALDLAL